MLSSFVWWPRLIAANKTGQLTPICLSFLQLAGATHRMLKAGVGLEALPFETSFTDFWLMELASRHPNEIAVRWFRAEEPEVGADWEWWFVGHGRSIGMRVQAKRLNEPTGRYDGVGRMVQGSRQIDTLVTRARTGPAPTVPLYCFYNGPSADTPGLKWAQCCTQIAGCELRGCTIALAETVARRLGAGNSLHIGVVAPDSIPWSDLVCCAGDDVISSCALALVRLGASRDGLVRDSVPDYVRAILTRQDPGDSEHVSHLGGVVVLGETGTEDSSARG